MEENREPNIVDFTDPSDEIMDINDVKQIMKMYAIRYAIYELKNCIEHPTKPGYQRSDIVRRIKELEQTYDIYCKSISSLKDE